MMPQRLTARQAQCLGFVRAFIAEEGYPPTFREIGLSMGIRSTNGVQDHLVALERKGWIRRNPGRSRGIAVLAEPERLVGPELRAEARTIMVDDPAEAEILIAEALRRRRAAS